MTAVTLKVTGSEKENVTAIVLSGPGGSYRWGHNGGTGLNGTLNVVPGTYQASFFAGGNPQPQPAGPVDVPDQPAFTLDVDAD
jgi:hypothetical protein